MTEYVEKEEICEEYEKICQKYEEICQYFGFGTPIYMDLGT